MQQLQHRLLLMSSLALLCWQCQTPLALEASSSNLQDVAPEDAAVVGIGGPMAGRPAQSCSPVVITVPMCQGISYNTTTDRLTYGKQLDDLVQVPCAPFLRLFVCSMHLPFCNREQSLLVLPCREFCVHIRDLCSPVLEHFGYQWPARLACESLPPEYGSGSSKNLCLRPRAEDFESQLASMQSQRPNLLSSLAQERHPPRRPSLQEATARIPLATPTRYNINEARPSARQCSAAEVRLSGTAEPTQSSNNNNSVVEECAPRCHASLQFFAEDKQFASAWMLVWSILCLACTGLAVATFLLDSDRFCFPERPIVWVAVCYALHSMAHLVRAGLGPDVACSSANSVNGLDSHRASRYAGHWCAVIFLLLYFSWLAGLLWWLALSLCWYLCAVKKWAHEALSSKSVWLHLIAWGVPLILSVLLLVLHRVEADELTHLCVVDGSQPGNLLAFVIVPCALALVLGMGLLSCALCASVTVRDSLKWSGNMGFRRLERLMSKIGLFSILYVLPTMCVLAANVYEYVERSSWQSSLEKILARPECVDAGGIRLDRGQACSPEQRPSAALYMLKIFMTLAAGLPSGLIIWANAKSGVAWRSCFCRVLLRRKSTSAASSTAKVIDSLNSNSGSHGLGGARVASPTANSQQRRLIGLAGVSRV